MGVESIAENSANKENYAANESDLDRAIEAIAELKTKDPAAAKKINNLEAHYEQAIRLRRMRIDTLESHISDRDDELVEYRRHMEVWQRNNCKLKVVTAVLAVACILLLIMMYIPNEATAALEFAARTAQYTYSKLPNTPLAMCAATALVTTAVNMCLRK